MCLSDTMYVTVKSVNTSFIGTHCSTVCWETVGVLFLAHPVYFLGLLCNRLDSWETAFFSDNVSASDLLASLY